MRSTPATRAVLAATTLFALVAAVLAVAAPSASRPGSATHKPATAASPAGGDTIAAASRIQVQELAPLLELPADQRPALIHVGFPSLYHTAHIAGSVYAGPASKPEGLRALRAALKPLPRDRAVVLYCGCCPWKDCPNVRPALRAARAMGFRGVHVLYLEKNLRQSGLAQGLPEAHGD